MISYEGITYQNGWIMFYMSMHTLKERLNNVSRKIDHFLRAPEIMVVISACICRLVCVVRFDFRMLLVYCGVSRFPFVLHIRDVMPKFVFHIHNIVPTYK